MGDRHTDKSKDTIWIYSQNVHGISTNDYSSDFTVKLHVMLEWKVDIMGWSETNLEWNDYKVQQELYKQLKSHMPGSSWKLTTSGVPSDTPYKPGGNLMVLSKPVRARTWEFNQDRMGRWVWTMIYGKVHNILIVQLYVLGSEKGIFSTYAQQYLQIKWDIGTETPYVIHKYFVDLHIFLEKYKHSQKIIMGDFNQSIEEEEIQEIVQRHDLYDVFQYAHPTQEELNTH